MKFADSNVLIDVFEYDPVWFDWSADALTEASEDAPIMINPIVVAEISSRFADLPMLRRALDRMAIEIVPFDDPIAFEAGHRFREYRRRHRSRDAILADFLIGAHALSLGATLLTRDTRIYRRYFPELALITPKDDDG